MKKTEKYAEAFRMIQSVVEGESDMVANMANVAALLHEAFGFWWTGFYRVGPESGQLVLGPFQGPVACTRINFGKGVCGSAWKEASTLVVPDVDMFPGHIACSSESRSEIVVPVFSDGEITGVLDIDSKHTGTFDDTDRQWLERIVKLLSKCRD